jgi:hypothetical protein
MYMASYVNIGGTVSVAAGPTAVFGPGGAGSLVTFVVMGTNIQIGVPANGSTFTDWQLAIRVMAN